MNWIPLKSISGFRLAVTALSVVYLAFAIQNALSYLSVARGSYEPLTLEVFGSAGNINSRLWFNSLIADGGLLRFPSTQYSKEWVYSDNSGMPAYLYCENAAHALVSFRAKTFVAVFHGSGWSGLIRVKRNGTTVQSIFVDQAEKQQDLIAVEDPVVPRSTAVFWVGLTLFAFCGWWFGPWRNGRSPVVWLVFFLSLVHLLYWVCSPVGVSNDSSSYFEAASSVLSGIPSYYSPGYGTLLHSVGFLAGPSLGTSVTFIQHGFVVLGACWLYLLFRHVISENLALLGAILAGVIAPAMTPTQGLLSESATAFAMIGTLYFVLQSFETGKQVFAVAGGILAGWAGLLRVVPLAALVPAVCLLYVWRRPKPSMRVAVVAAASVAAVFLAPIVWIGIKSGEPRLVNSLGYHFYNRAVEDQKLLNRKGPATQRLLQLTEGQDPRSLPWWLLPAGEMLSPERERLLRDVAVESIRTDPVGFAVYTFRLAWRDFVAPTDWITPWGETLTADRSFEPPSPLPFSVSALKWRLGLERINESVWPVLCWTAIAGTLIGLTGRHRIFVLGIAWIPLGYLLPTAVSEAFCPRYNAPIVPFVVMLAMFSLDWIRAAVTSPPAVRSASRPDAQDPRAPA
jgi:hypothetical protein